jgi:mannose-6-phosphate isomerase-like protein (cupin superfamily)
VTPTLSNSRAIGVAYVEVEVGKISRAHYHSLTEEVYYILSGEGSMTINGSVRLVKPGDCVYIPPNAVHSIANVGSTALRFISADAPPYDPEDDIEVEVRPEPNES